jgi:mannose-6-phosphate isomerase-like protein (cupin superfamily)
MNKQILINPCFKDRVTILETGKETSGAYDLLEVELDPAGGNSLHYHTSFSETFIPVEGTLGVVKGKQKLELKPGSTATIEKGEMHCFFNPGDSIIRFRVKIAPSNINFLQSLGIVYGLAADGLTNKTGRPNKLAHMAILLDLSDTRVPGFFGLITPLLLRKARSKRTVAMRKELVEKYCNS